MSADEARDWLSVAAQEVMDYPAGILSTACLSARRSCTHHAQIIPHIVQEAEAAIAERQRLNEFAPGVHALLAKPKVFAPALTQAQVDEIVAERGMRMSVCMDRGDIVREGDIYVPAMRGMTQAEFNKLETGHSGIGYKEGMASE